MSVIKQAQSEAEWRFPDQREGFVDGMKWVREHLSDIMQEARDEERADIYASLDRGEVGKALASHWYDPNTEMCDCGWMQFTASDSSYDNHLADAVIALIKGEENDTE